MSTYRKEWDCCGSVTETDAWEPEACPFCIDTAAPFRKDAERYRKWRADYTNHSDVPVSAMLLALADACTDDDVDAAIDAAPPFVMPNV